MSTIRIFLSFLLGIPLIGPEPGGCGPVGVEPMDDDDLAWDDDDDWDDDDSWGDDDDDDTWGDEIDDDDAMPEPQWFAYSFMLDIDGETDTGTVEAVITAYEGDESGLGDEICDQAMVFASEVTYGPDAGADFPEFADQVVDWTGPGTETENGCWWDPVDMYGEEWDIAFEWLFNPLLFVSCDATEDFPDLYDLDIGPDPFGMVEGDPLSLGEMCEEVGPQLADAVGTGEMEGIWLIPMPDGWIDGFGNYSYFEPEDTTNVESWGFFGYVLNDISNNAGFGLDGVYYTVNFLVLG